MATQTSMAHVKHVEILPPEASTSGMHRRREKQEFVVPDLSEANLMLADLQTANLAFGDFRWANLQGAVLNKADLTSANLYQARAARAELRATVLRGAYLQEADLGGADLRKAELSEARLQRVDLRNADLCGADLRWSDLRQADLGDAKLDNALLTGAQLWEARRTRWSIKNITCERAFWDEEGAAPTAYEVGEFERLHADVKTVELHYSGGITLFEINTLPLLMHRLAQLNPDSLFRLQSLGDTAGGSRVVLAVDAITTRDLEKLRADALQLQEVQQEARKHHELASKLEAKLELMTDTISQAFTGIKSEI